MASTPLGRKVDPRRELAPVTPEALLQHLAAGEIVMTTAEAWQRVRDQFEVIEEHDTGVAGSLLILRGPGGLCAVEEPRPDERILRPLEDAAAAAALVRERMAAYEKMWDGCGVKIDYRS